RQLAIPRHARLEVNDGLGRRGVSQHVHFAAHDVLDGPEHSHRQRGDHQLLEVDLAAEAASYLSGGHADLVLGQPERLRELVADVERRLRAGPDGKLARSIVVGDGRMRLDVALVYDGRAPGMLDHDIGLREASLDVTALEVHLRGDIARLAFSLLLFDANRNVPAFLRPVDISKL